MGVKNRITELKIRTAQVFIALKSKKTPWYAKAVAAIAVAYALSPIDLIPDFIPVLGYIDDLIILPILIKLTSVLIPKHIWMEFEQHAKEIWKDGQPKRWYYSIPIVVIWLLVIYFIVKMVC